MAEWSETSSVPESSIGSTARNQRVLAPGQINGYVTEAYLNPENGCHRYPGTFWRSRHMECGKEGSLQPTVLCYKSSSFMWWMCCLGTFLTYYKSSKMTKLLAAMSLPQVGDIRLMGEIEDDKGKGYLFQIDLMDRMYVLRALTKEEAIRWVNALTALRNDPARKAKEAEEAAIRAAQKPTAKIEKMSKTRCCFCCWSICFRGGSQFCPVFNKFNFIYAVSAIQSRFVRL